MGPTKPSLLRIAAAPQLLQDNLAVAGPRPCASSEPALGQIRRPVARARATPLGARPAGRSAASSDASYLGFATALRR